jgi:hypothetical protein
MTNAIPVPDPDRLDPSDEAELRGYLEAGEHDPSGLSCDFRLAAALAEIDALRADVRRADERAEAADAMAMETITFASTAVDRLHTRFLRLLDRTLAERDDARRWAMRLFERAVP